MLYEFQERLYNDSVAFKSDDDKLDKKITQICNFVYPYVDKHNKIQGWFGRKG